MPPKQNALLEQRAGADRKRRPPRREKANGATPDRRELILAAATRRFAEFGFEATTVRQIADDVSILSGSLYHHFATKEDILDEIVHGAVIEARDETVRIAGLPIDAEQRLATLIVAELHRLVDSHEVYSIVFNERKFFRRNEDFRYLTKARAEAYEAWRTVVVEGVAEGLFHPDTNIFLTISTALRMLNTGAEWYTHEDGSRVDTFEDYSLESLVEFYLGFVLRSIRAPARAGLPIPPPPARP